jgi:glc operon protein GlcG
MKLKAVLAVVLLAQAAPSIASAQLAEKKILTLAAAEKIANAAASEAKKRNATVVIVVVDDGGYPLIVKRLDDTQVASVDVGIGKARTAAIFRRPSRDFEEQIKNGRAASLVLPGATPLQGGLPLIYQGKTVGAIGVSGNTPQEDEDIAKAGVIAFDSAREAQQSAVSYLPAKQVNQAYANGMNLVKSQNYKVDASHRDAPGVVEVHTKDTDIIYMLEGTATLVTGGRLIDGKTIEPEEIRGSDTIGGESRVITKGDIIVIPNNTPHWFKEVNSAVNYYVVKVRAVD